MSSRDTCSIDAVQSDSVIIFQHADEELISPASQIQTNCSDLPPSSLTPVLAAFPTFSEILGAHLRETLCPTSLFTVVAISQLANVTMPRAR